MKMMSKEAEREIVAFPKRNTNLGFCLYGLVSGAERGAGSIERVMIYIWEILEALVMKRLTE